jgi:hypothetical protein
MSMYYAENKDKIKNKIKTLIRHICNTSHLYNKTAYSVLSLRDGIQTILYISCAVLHCSDCERLTASSSIGSLKIDETQGLLLTCKIGSSCEQDESIAISKKVSTTA